MAYIGNTPDVNTFAAGSDNFNGDDVTTTFTLSRKSLGVNDVIAVIDNVVQDPFTAYTLVANNTSGTADIIFASAPSTGTGTPQSKSRVMLRGCKPSPLCSQLLHCPNTLVFQSSC